MSMRCEDVRPLLAELVYEEVDAAVAEDLRDHLGTCLSCRRQQMAFMAVREDLQQWQPEGTATPQGVTFITSDSRGTAGATRPIWQNPVFQGLATAAGFMFVTVLTAAAVNLQVQSGPEGWAVSTSLGQSQELRAAEPPTVSLTQIPELDEWLDTRLDAQFGTRLEERGVVTLASMPRQQFFTDGQVDELTQRVTAVLDQTLAEHDSEARGKLDTALTDMQYYVDTSVKQQEERFFFAVANVVEGLQADHRDEIFQLTQQFSTMHADTDRKADEAHWRIDELELLSLATPTRSPEQ